MLVLDRGNNCVRHAVFRDLIHFLTPGDLLVLNDTRVIRARLIGRKSRTRGKVEIFLLRNITAELWEVLVRGRKVRKGLKIFIDHDITAEIIDNLEGGRKLVRFSGPVETILDQIGEIPLPPYIHNEEITLEHYQTVYAQTPGSVAAPTAGLHFSEESLEKLSLFGLNYVFITLHIGLDTFAPLRTDLPQDHLIHSEWCQVSPEAAQTINAHWRAGSRIVAVGTSSVRALETAALQAKKGEAVASYQGQTNLFILPGFRFQIVDAMVTNFHLPKSTLLMLVSAFVGRERLLSVYKLAIKEGYRFYSFGDTMLII